MKQKHISYQNSKSVFFHHSHFLAQKKINASFIFLSLSKIGSSSSQLLRNRQVFLKCAFCICCKMIFEPKNRNLAKKHIFFLFTWPDKQRWFFQVSSGHNPFILQGHLAHFCENGEFYFHVQIS